MSAWQIGKPRLTLMLIPLSVGLLVRARREAVAGFCEPYLRQASTVFLVLAILLAVAANYQNVLRNSRLQRVPCGTLLLLISLGLGLRAGWSVCRHKERRGARYSAA